MNYILLGEPAQRRAEAEMLVADAKAAHPEQFDGNRDCFLFELRYCEPFEDFKELKRLQGAAAVAAGRRDEFRGYVIMDLSTYLTHHTEHWLKVTLLFLADMSDYWRYIFLVDNRHRRTAEDLAAAVLGVLLPNGIPCLVEGPTDIKPAERVDAILRELGVHCTADLQTFLRKVLDSGFDRDIVSSMVTDAACTIGNGGVLGMTHLTKRLTDKETALRYMLTVKDFERLTALMTERGKENEDNGWKEAV